ncbi:type II toxin-antitoxin system VapC family toxin [Prosthecomicrobium sp. N25]|uniref:type II toxin-antitoxin system VapC family toxin n=1 Tax=Prosthecomicrobium sp. N25 TaxID=3129254 RepID=UPI00307884DF
MRIYLDANFFIAYVENPELDLSPVVRWCARDGWRLVTSEFTLAEVLVLPLKIGDASLARSYEELMASEQVIQVMSVSRAVLMKCAEVRATIGNRTPDAIHIATALLAGCDVFLSSDQRIRLPAGLRRVPLGNIAELDSKS